MTLDESTTKALIRKIKALLAKTVEQGATESEAMLAMTKAHELLAKYQLNLSDLDIKEEGTEHINVLYDSIKDDLCVNVAKYCECKVWTNKAKGEIHFLGISTDAQFAEWLILALADFVTRQELDYMFSDDVLIPRKKSKRDAKQAGHQTLSFVQGCVARINERLREEVRKREMERYANRASGRDLVPLKNAMINEAFSKLGIALYTSYSRNNGKNVDPFAYSAGQKAGNNVGFNRPVNRDSYERKLLK